MINTICLCGSMRFLDDFPTANIELTKRGFSVITISMVMVKDGSAKEDEGLKEYLDLVHLNKILRADAIFVVGDGYIGRSTAREILWAKMQGKAIFTQVGIKWHELNPEGTVVTSWNDVRAINYTVEHPVIDRARKVLGI